MFPYRRLVEHDGTNQGDNVKDAEDLKYSSSSSSSSINNEADELEENCSKAETFGNIQGIDTEVIEVERKEGDIQFLGSHDKNVCSNISVNSNDNDQRGFSNIKKSPKKNLKRDRFNVEIQALTICKHHVFGENANKSVVNCIIIGRKCSFVSREGDDVRRQTLSIAVIDKSDMKKIDSKIFDDKSKNVGSSVVHPFPGLVEDPMFYNDFGSYVTGDTGEFSVINEYLRASKQKDKDKKASQTKKKDSSRKETRCQEITLPSGIDAKFHRISHLFATKASLFVVVKCNEIIGKDAAHLDDEQDEDYSSVDSDTEIIEMPNSAHSKPDKQFNESFIFEFRWVSRGDKVVLHEPHISSRCFPCRDFLHDVIMISNKNLGFKEQRYDIVGEKVCVDATGGDVLLAATGIEQKQVTVISTVDLQTLSVIPLDKASPRSVIEHIVYCTGISVIACCFSDGKVMLCRLEDQPKKLLEEPKNEPIPQAGRYYYTYYKVKFMLFSLSRKVV